MLPPVDSADLARSLVDRFDAVASAWPSKTAMRTTGASVDYRTLQALSAGIARLLRESVTTAASAAFPVVTLLPQGIAAVAAQLGVLRAGAFYVPLDPGLPPDAVAALVRRVGAPVVLGTSGTLAGMRGVLAGIATAVDVAAADPDSGSARFAPIDPDRLAYVYFTSGSTGAPKGVMDSHRNVLHNVLRYTRSLAIGPDDRLTLLQPPSFSGAVSSTYAALLNGATLLPYDLAADGPAGLAPFLDAEGATVYHSVPSIFRNFVAGRAAFASLRIVRLEGDRALGRDARLFQRHFRRGCRLVNGLGTTETGLVRQYFVDHDTPVGDGPLPIGHAVEGVACHVLRGDGTPCAPDETGEIVVAGRHLALGYWQDDALTRRKFVADVAGRRYHTGDLGRLRADGCLEYVGRAAAETRIRGETIDRTAVEQALLQLAGVRDAAVVEHDDDGEVMLVAAVATAPQGGWSPPALRSALARVLPERAVPSRFAIVDALPLTPFGKVDRAAVARAVARPASGTGAATAPGDDIERRLAAIWTGVLGLASVQVGVPFLDQGGDSLRAMQVLVRVHDAFGVQLTPAMFFRLATVAEQAHAVRDALAGEPRAHPA